MGTNQVPNMSKDSTTEPNHELNPECIQSSIGTILHGAKSERDKIFDILVVLMTYAQIAGIDKPEFHRMCMAAGVAYAGPLPDERAEYIIKVSHLAES